MLAKILSYALDGLMGYAVDVEVDINSGLPGYDMVGRGRHFLVYHAREHLNDLTKIFKCVYVYAFDKTCLSCV